MAGVVKRLANMFTGGVEKWVDEHEDPIMALEQDIKEGVTEYSKLVGQHGVVKHQVEEARKDVQKYEDLINQYNQIARAAVSQGNDTDATRALEMVSKYEEMLETAKSTCAQYEQTEHQMHMDMLEYADLLERSKTELKQLKSQMAGAKAKEAKAEFKGSFLGGANDRIGRAKSRVAERVAKAEAADASSGIGSTADPLLSKYDVSNASASSRLAALKAEMGVN